MRIPITNLISDDMYAKLQNDGLDLIVGDPDDLLSIKWVITSSEDDHFNLIK